MATEATHPLRTIDPRFSDMVQKILDAAEQIPFLVPDPEGSEKIHQVFKHVFTTCYGEIVVDFFESNYPGQKTLFQKLYWQIHAVDYLTLTKMEKVLKSVPDPLTISGQEQQESAVIAQNLHNLVIATLQDLNSPTGNYALGCLFRAEAIFSPIKLEKETIATYLHTAFTYFSNTGPNDPNAQFALGEMYRINMMAVQEGSPDVVPMYQVANLARICYEKAKAAGHPKAQEALDELPQLSAPKKNVRSEEDAGRNKKRS